MECTESLPAMFPFLFRGEADLLLLDRNVLDSLAHHRMHHRNGNLDWKNKHLAPYSPAYMYILVLSW